MKTKSNKKPKIEKEKIKRLYIVAGPEREDEFSIKWLHVKEKRKDTLDRCLREARYRNFEHLFRYYIIDAIVPKNGWDDFYTYRSTSDGFKELKRRRLTRKQVDKLFV
jgi:hypothetical protein